MNPHSPIGSVERNESIEGSGDSDNDQNQFQAKMDGFENACKLMKEFIHKVERSQAKTSENIIFRFCGKYENLEFSAKHIQKNINKRLERMLKNRKIKRNWSEQDVQILVWTVIKYSNFHQIHSIENFGIDDWSKISALIPGTTAESCMFRILSFKKIRLSEQKWTEQESEILSSIISKEKITDWRVVAQELYKRNKNSTKNYRNPKQCKEHWTCYLNPQIRKGPWKIQEDIMLFQFILNNNGKKKYSEMAKFFKGRTENALKNRFSLLLDRFAGGYLQETQEKRIEIALKNLYQQKSLEANTDYRYIPRRGDNEIFEDQSNHNQNQEQKVLPQQKNPIKQEQLIKTNQNQTTPNNNNNNFHLNFPLIYQIRSPIFLMFSNQPVESFL